MKAVGFIGVLACIGIAGALLTKVAPKSIHPAKVISGFIICIAGLAVAAQIGLVAFVIGIWLLPIVTIIALVYFAAVALTDKWKKGD